METACPYLKTIECLVLMSFRSEDTLRCFTVYVDENGILDLDVELDIHYVTLSLVLLRFWIPYESQYSNFCYELATKTTYLVLAKLEEYLSNLELSCLDLVSYCQNGAKLVRNTLLNGPWIPNWLRTWTYQETWQCMRSRTLNC